MDLQEGSDRKSVKTCLRDRFGRIKLLLGHIFEEATNNSATRWKTGTRCETLSVNMLTPMSHLMIRTFKALVVLFAGSLFCSSVYANERVLFQCLEDFQGPVLSKSFSYEGVCTKLDDSDNCYYYDYRKTAVPDQTIFDQRDIDTFQVTFPQLTHMWRAINLRGVADNQYCWVGGSFIGRNPLATSWGGTTGSKQRKNNFLEIGKGHMTVDGIRIHNIHDAFYVGSNKGGLSVLNSWISYNRDDFFEGYLHNIEIDNTLIDGTYAFISDPDGSCRSDKSARNSIITIENSLIRLQRMPGPFGSGGIRWHWSGQGGHGQLWKRDSCGWKDWPRFVLNNNIFLIEGPYSTRHEISAPKCDNGLPGHCKDELLSQLQECSNNVFLYTDYEDWADNGVIPGPTPSNKSRFYNPSNPEYQVNGLDCYQKMTDLQTDSNYGDVIAYWTEKRHQWIDRNASESNPSVAQIPGVDYPVLSASDRFQLKNVRSGQCLESFDDGTVDMQACDTRAENQRFSIEPMNNGKLAAGVAISVSQGGYLSTQDELVLELSGSDKHYKDNVSWAQTDLQHRDIFYIYPLQGEPGIQSTDTIYAIESDGLRRSFLYQHGKGVSVQGLFKGGKQTPLPQNRFKFGNDQNLQWQVVLSQ